jgi:integrase
MLLALPKTADGRVVHSARGFRLRESNSLSIYKKHVLEALKDEFPTPPDELGFADGTFHSFRHFFASQCLISGASEGEVREWLGHRDSKIVERYRHLRSEDAQRRMSQIDFLRQDDDPQHPGKTA